MSGFGPACSYKLSLGYAFTLVPNQPNLTSIITSNDPNVLFLHFSDLKKDLKNIYQLKNGGLLADVMLQGESTGLKPEVVFQGMLGE